MWSPSYIANCRQARVRPRGRPQTDIRRDPRDHGWVVDAESDEAAGVVPDILLGNRLLAALTVEEQRRLGADLTVVEFGLRQQVYDIDEAINQVYFPLTCVLSVVAAVDEDDSVEIATVGFEGMAGLPVFLGADTSPHRCFCQVPGQALRLGAVAMRRFLAGDGALHNILHRYTHAMMIFVAQNVACNRLHSAEERTARWLAHTRDRVGSDNFPMTQDFLAQMLGVRRGTVSLSARFLQRAGLIRYSRGRITVLDRDGLDAAACGCYAIIRREFERIA